MMPEAPYKLVAEVLVGLASDTLVYLSRWGETVQVKNMTFTIRALAPWAPRAPSVYHPGPGTRNPRPECRSLVTDAVPLQMMPQAPYELAAEMLVGLATDPTGY